MSVKILNNGPPGTLIGGLSAVSLDGRRGYDVPLRDSGPMGHATGSYPWRIEGDSRTIVSITNVSDRLAKYHARIIFPGGTYWLPEDNIAVGGTATFDLRELRDDAVPDMWGNTLPEGVTAGQFRWSTIESRGDTQLTGRAEIVSASEDRSSSYSCFMCCGDSVNYGFLSPSSVGPPLDYTTDTGVYAHWYDCYGNDAGSYGASASSWWVQYPSVASAWTVTSGVGRTQANDAGSTDFEGSWTAYEVYQDPGDWELCDTDYFTVNAPGTEQSLVPTYVAIFGTPAYTQGPPAPYVYNVNREILDQNHNPLTGVRYVEESYSPNPATANNPPTPVCTSDTISTHNANSNDQGIFGPDLYSLSSGPPNPCSMASVQHFKVGGRDVTPEYNVTWTYSGVTVSAR